MGRVCHLLRAAVTMSFASMACQDVLQIHVALACLQTCSHFTESPHTLDTHNWLLLDYCCVCRLVCHPHIMLLSTVHTSNMIQQSVLVCTAVQQPHMISYATLCGSTCRRSEEHPPNLDKVQTTCVKRQSAPAPRYIAELDRPQDARRASSSGEL